MVDEVVRDCTRHISRYADCGREGFRVTVCLHVVRALEREGLWRGGRRDGVRHVRRCRRATGRMVRSRGRRGGEGRRKGKTRRRRPLGDGQGVGGEVLRMGRRERRGGRETDCECDHLSSPSPSSFADRVAVLSLIWVNCSLRNTSLSLTPPPPHALLLSLTPARCTHACLCRPLSPRPPSARPGYSFCHSQPGTSRNPICAVSAPPPRPRQPDIAT